MGRTWGFGYMNWREYITRFSSDVEFNPPATESEIAASEARLNVSFPEKLRELLLQSNGVLDRYKTPFIWSADEIAKRNIEMRSYPGFEELYMPFDHLLFFGDAGDGDLFSFAILAGKIRYPFIFQWEHESDGRIQVAGHLETFVDWWLSAINEDLIAAGL
jgi:SMI1-KNR4 cell-wall